MNDKRICWIDGAFRSEKEAMISVWDHGLLYGDGVFEGIRFYRRQPFRLQEHLHRLADSAAAIALALPLPLEAIAEACREIARRYADEDGYIRLLITRGTGGLGLDPRRCRKASIIILADRLSLTSAESMQRGIRVAIAATRRPSADVLDPRIKSLNYLNNILARMEATAAGADEAILLNASGFVAEGTADNVFIAKNGRLLTPRLADGALAGITRAVVLDIAHAAGIAASETSLTPYDLYTCDECFLTGTGAELIPVAEIDGRRLRHSTGPLYRRISEMFRETVLQESDQHARHANDKVMALHLP